MARRFTTNDVLTLATGSAPTARAGTWLVLIRPYDSTFDILATNTDFVATLTGTSAVQELFLDAGKIFSVNDFGSGATGPTDKNGWYALGFTKVSGNNTVRYHLAPVGGSYAHSPSGTNTDGTAGITSIIFGKGPVKNGAKFDIAAGAMWSAALSDSAIDALGSSSMDTWLAASPDAAWQFNQASTGTAVNDLIGSANQTALTGTSVVADPVGWSYHVATTPFTKDVVETYRVFNVVTKDVVERYRVLNAFTKDVTESYRVTNALTKDVVERYRVTNAFAKDVVETYRVLNTWTANVVERYRVLGVWSKDVVERYTVFAAILKDVVERYRIYGIFVKDIVERYDIGDHVGLPADVIAYLTAADLKADLSARQITAYLD